MAYRVLLGFGFAVGVASLGGIVNHFAHKSDLPMDLAAGALRRVLPPPLKHQWRLINGKHWQIISSPVEARETTDALEDNRGACPAGMVQVTGEMKLDYALGPYDPRSIEEMQKTTCIKWINRDYPERCAEFDREKWLSISRELPTKPMSFCMDRFEYPNQKGEYPVIMANFREAEKLCQAEGKRLCDEAEWTFACEGEEAMPYPYGYVRDAEACIVDQKWRPYNGRAMMPRDGAAAMCEMDKLWQGVASGSLPRCRSPFGVYDMTGNVDEWTNSIREGERPSILKGGYWGPVRTRCRPSTRSHDENHAFYQQGFRCCTAVGSAAVKRSFVSDPSTAPLPRELR